MTRASTSPIEVDANDLRVIADEVRGLREDLRSALAAFAGQSNGAVVNATTNTTPEAEPLLKIRDVCKLLDVSPRTFQRLRLLKDAPKTVELGGTLRWRRGDVDRWLEKKARR